MPLRLTRAEIEKPSEVVQAFIIVYDLPAIRQNFDEMLSRIFFTKPLDPLQLIWFREEMERFIEAVYIMYKPQPEQAPVPDLRQFMAIIAHELQNQLAGMMAIITTIEGYKETNGSYAAEASAYFDMMKVAVSNAQAVYTNMQMATKVSGTGFEIKPQITAYNPFTFLNSIVKSLASIEQVQGNTIKTQIMIGEEVEAFTDINMLRQILTNLLLNALKHSNPATTIKLHAMPIKDHIQISVTSTGQQILKDMQDRIFEPFFVLDKAKAGSGLGLHVCKLYASALGGEIRVHSTSKGITAFTITIPISPNSKQQAI